jgi:polyisoprenoid-binding protein YceI
MEASTPPARPDKTDHHHTGFCRPGRRTVMTTATTRKHPESQYESLLPTGRWRVDPTHSSAEFTARLAGRPIRGQLPLTGEVVIAAPVDDSTANLIAAPEAISTGHGMLDRLLAGPGFLHAEHFPQISFQSQALVCVPIGWRAIGQLQVKGAEHPIVSELAADLRPPHTPATGTITITSRWILDSTWITTQRVLTLSRHVDMRCTLALNHVPAGS